MGNHTDRRGSTGTYRGDSGELGSVTAVHEEANAGGYLQHNQSLSEIRAVIHAETRQKILSQPSRRRPWAATEAVNVAFDEWDAGAEQGPTQFEQRRREGIEKHRQRRETLQHATEARARLYLRVHRHKLASASTSVSLTGRSRESHSRPRSAARRGPARSRAPASDSDSSEPGPGPSWPGDDSFTDEEAVDLARKVVEDCGGSLTPARFDTVTYPYLFGLEGEQLSHAKLLIFLELPDRLQQSFYNAIRIGHATWTFPETACDAARQLRSDQAGGVS